MAMRRPVQGAGPGTSGVGVIVGCKFGSTYPHIWDFLCDNRWDDDSEREVGTLLITSGDGKVRVWLNDRAGQASAWVSGSSLSEALERAENGLEGEDLEWRSTALQSQKRSGKRS